MIDSRRLALRRCWKCLLCAIAIASIPLLAEEASSTGNGICLNGELCTEPCPAANVCYANTDCADGLGCRPTCIPSACWCNKDAEWACLTDCLWECQVRTDPPGPPTYSITDLGTLGGSSSVALGMNEIGQVVGSADTVEGKRHAFLWENGAMTDLGTSGTTTQSEAADVNHLGQVVGLSSSTGNPAIAFLWLPDAAYGLPAGMSNLGVNGGNADAINDAGQVVGSMIVGPAKKHAFRWENGTTIDITVAGFPTGVPSDINAAGAVVGGGFLWDDVSGATDLGTLGGQLVLTQA